MVLIGGVHDLRPKKPCHGKTMAEKKFTRASSGFFPLKTLLRDSSRFGIIPSSRCNSKVPISSKLSRSNFRNRDPVVLKC